MACWGHISMVNVRGLTEDWAKGDKNSGRYYPNRELAINKSFYLLFQSYL